MSTSDIRVHKAIVHSVNAETGICYVKIPAITGQKIVKVGTEGLTQAEATGLWNVPRVGDLCLVSLSRGNADVNWVSGMYADLYRVDENYVTTSKLATDAIKSLNYLPPYAGGVYEQIKYVDDTTLTWVGTTLTTATSFFEVGDVGRPLRVAYSDEGWPSGPVTGQWVNHPLVTIVSYTSATEVEVSETAPSDLEWIGYFIMPSSTGVFSTTGSFFDLEDGTITTPGFQLDSENVRVRGAISATEMAAVDNLLYQPLWSIDPVATVTSPFASGNGSAQLLHTNNDYAHNIGWVRGELNESLFNLEFDSPRVVSVTDEHAPLDGLSVNGRITYYGTHEDMDEIGVGIGDRWKSLISITPGRLHADYDTYQPFMDFETGFFPDTSDVDNDGTALSQFNLLVDVDSFFTLNSTIEDPLGTPSKTSQATLLADDIGLYGKVDVVGEWVDWTTSGIVWASGWGNYSVSWQSLQIRKIGDIVYIRGMVYRASGTGTTILTLPVGYRPPIQNMFTSMTDTGAGRTDIQASGNIVAVTGGVGFREINLCFSTK